MSSLEGLSSCLGLLASEPKCPPTIGAPQFGVPSDVRSASDFELVGQGDFWLRRPSACRNSEGFASAQIRFAARHATTLPEQHRASAACEEQLTQPAMLSFYFYFLDHQLVYQPSQVDTVDTTDRRCHPVQSSYAFYCPHIQAATFFGVNRQRSHFVMPFQVTQSKFQSQKRAGG